LEGWRLVLLQSVADELATVTRRPQLDTALSLVQRNLIDAYSAQLRALGAPPPKEAASPAALVRAEIDHWSERVSKQTLTPEDRQLLESMPHQLAAVDYVAATDLQRTILLERTLLQVLEIAAHQRRPQSSTAAASLRDELRARDRQATELASQLRDGQRALAGMWRLLAVDAGDER
jgi:hypothetical protein